MIKLQSLKGHNSFESHFPGGKRFFGQDMMLSLRLSGKNLELPQADEPLDEYVLRYGVSVKKKTCPKAVVRNRIKRLMREYLRQEIKSSAEKDRVMTSLRNWESVLIFWNTRIDRPGLINLNDIRNSAAPLFMKAIQFTEKVTIDRANR